MRRICVMALAVCLASPAPAQRIDVASAQELRDLMDQGNGLEVRVDGDLNGDGQRDTAFIERGDDARKLTVLIAYKDNVNTGHGPVGTLGLDTAPLGPAELAITKGVLVVKDLTGGTSATAATYRYRYDAAAKKMRLIGLDATAYSRTFQTDSFAISWNLLTGDFVSSWSKLKAAGANSDEAYDTPLVKRRKRLSKPLYLDTTPSPDEIISGEKWPTN